MNDQNQSGKPETNSGGDFQTIQLDDNPLRTLKIWANLCNIVREKLVNFLKANPNLFGVSPLEMAEIDLSMHGTGWM